MESLLVERRAAPNCEVGAVDLFSLNIKLGDWQSLAVRGRSEGDRRMSISGAQILVQD